MTKLKTPSGLHAKFKDASLSVTGKEPIRYLLLGLIVGGVAGIAFGVWICKHLS